MITSTVKAFDHTGEWEAALVERTLAALNAAAEVAAAIATARAQGLPGGDAFSPIPAGRSAEGFASGCRAANRKWYIFDHGSLGNRNKQLKRDRRKQSWQVTRQGTTYTATRRSTTTGGVSPRNISNPARTAGRQALIDALKGL